MQNEELKYFTYILQCSDSSLYTGWTNDLEKRLTAHNAGKGARYTRGRTPVKLLFSRAFASKREAMQLEYQLKLMKRQQKLDLVNETSRRS